MASFRKFGSMSMEQQAQFLENAQRWEKMPEQDKEKWRNVPPLPPLPQRLTPPSSRQSASTNQ
jgi:hypothetical protein